MLLLLCCSVAACHPVWAQVPTTRQSISLNNNWRTIAHDSNQQAYVGFEKSGYDDAQWKRVNVPHNWDAYEGYRRMRHGNRHGYAWYRTSFQLKKPAANRRVFVFFEGVGSFATVWLNGQPVGKHAGGRTSFTIDITSHLQQQGNSYTLAVRADHPSQITTLPWVCGGCSDERGFSEGSQPMGIFRPVQLIITNEVRVAPFGVHVWNDTTATAKRAQLHLATTVSNNGKQPRTATVVNQLYSQMGELVTSIRTNATLAAGATKEIPQALPTIGNPTLWSTTHPYLYRLVTSIFINNKLVDKVTTPYGIRTIRWPVANAVPSNQFLLNGKPVFINGVAEYEHLLGNSHAFGDVQIRSRAMQVRAAGFNAFRDGHQPHNLRYNNYWDSLGILWWTQQSAHVWYDTPEFRENFKVLLKEWVIERRNSPSVVMWGLQNESKLPEAFARECTELIRSLDPTASSQRVITTCNGGSGTDWDVPQNWTGTYGGNPATYSTDLKQQILVGEYGAWRTLDLHTEGAFDQNGVYSEDRMTELMEQKLRLGEAAKDSTAGHFMWLLTSHDNPGRVQGGEGYRELDRIGPVNYKGLLTPWEEPLDIFYMYRSNYTDNKKEPMVYIASHTWPDRWVSPGKKDGIRVYSNCEEVELFNDVGTQSLGKRTRNGIGTHFRWDDVNIRYNVLYAVGYVGGKKVAADTIVLNHLPVSPQFNRLYEGDKRVTAPVKNYHYTYRINCGGPAYTDQYGNQWQSDRALPVNTTTADNDQLTGTASWYSSSWTNQFPGMPSFFASQRSTNDPITGTRDWPLFQQFRYSREQLQYAFPLPDGDYLVELFFTEPWWGTGGGMNCSGFRKFDVAINDKVVIKNLDIWKEVGHDAALKKSINAKVTGGRLVITFPEIASGQAVIAAIAIASLQQIAPAPPPVPLLLIKDGNQPGSNKINQPKEWLTTGNQQYQNTSISFTSLPPALYGASWYSFPTNATNPVTFTTTAAADIFIVLDSHCNKIPGWLIGFEKTNTFATNSAGNIFTIFKKRVEKNASLTVGENGQGDGASPAMYSLMATPATNMEPAYDLKPVLSLKAINAITRGPSITKGKVDGKDRVVVGEGENMVEWQFNIGAADIYSFTLTYNNPDSAVRKGRLEFLSADGKMLNQEEVTFTYTRPGKSNYINSTSITMINAGNYLVRLIAKDAPGLSVNSLEVQ